MSRPMAGIDEAQSANISAAPPGSVGGMSRENSYDHSRPGILESIQNKSFRVNHHSRASAPPGRSTQPIFGYSEDADATGEPLGHLGKTTSRSSLEKIADLPADIQEISHAKIHWDRQQVDDWLKSIGFKKHVISFAKNGIVGYMLDMLSEKHLTEMGLNVGEKLHFQLEVSRLNLFHYPPLPPSLKAALFQRELESQLAHLPLVEEGVELLDHTVYRNPTCIDGPTVIVPAYMEIRITALKNMNVNHLHYGIHLTFDLSLRTGGLPQSVRDHIIQDLSLQVNEACMPMSELNCNTVEEAGDIKITGHIAADSHVILFAGEREINFDMWVDFPFDRPVLILRLGLLPIRLSSDTKKSPWTVVFQMNEPTNYENAAKSMIKFDRGVDQMPQVL
mmetsp:Transcript_57949/g.160107  ORF Transcript_57949/g.160107 Transcript_57949/m.160107 type:complete len:392 (-) Transcript_57949:1305-2480(-)